jgi:hypothetical protein
MNLACFVRFVEKIDQSGECWIWTASKFENGYGQFQMNGKPRRVHRLMYEHMNGPIPEGMLVRHRCDNPICVNPAHLEVGTHLDNMRDMRVRGRAVSRPGESHLNAKFTQEQVEFIRSSCIPRHPELGGAALGRRFGVSTSAINSIMSGTRWKK